MTKKHYIAIAGILREAGDYTREDGEVLVWEKTIQDLADYFETDNKLFDRARFLKACGIES